MARFWSTLLILLVAFAVYLQLTIPVEDYGGREPLIWTAGNNYPRLEQIKIINQKNDDFVVVHDHANFDFRRIVLQASSGVGTDIFEVHTGNTLQMVAASGVCLDLSYYTEKFGFDLSQNVWPGIEEECVVDGIQYGFPLSLQINVLFYNKNIFDRFGVPYPHDAMTWEEFAHTAKRVTRRADTAEDSIYGYIDTQNWRTFFYSLKGEFFSDDGRRPLVNGEKMIKAVQTHLDMVFKHRVTLPVSRLDFFVTESQAGGAYRSIFADGKFAMLVRPRDTLGYFRIVVKNQRERLRRWENNPNRKEEDRPEVLRVGACLLPRFSDHVPAYYLRARSLVVNRMSPRKDLALKFLRFLTSEDYSRVVNQTLDFIPPNPAYAMVGVEEGEPELSEQEVYAANLRAMKYRHQSRKSPFLLDQEVGGAIQSQLARLELDPTLDVREALDVAQRECEELIQLNIRRDPALRQRYETLNKGGTL